MNSKLLLGLVLALALGVAVVVSALELSYRHVSGKGDFKKLADNTSEYFLYDLGAVDHDGDGSLEIFSVNHYASQSLLHLRDSDLEDLVTKVKLNPVPDYPGLETMHPDLPLATQPVAVYWSDSKLVFRTDAETEARASIYARTPLKISAGAQFTSVATTSDVDLERKRKVEIDLPPNGLVELAIEYLTVPMLIHFDPKIPLDAIGLGHSQISPASHTTEFRLKDRHGHAWFGPSGHHKHVYISNGGLKGELLQQPDPDVFSDELLRFDAELAGYRSTRAVGVRKNNCSAHQVSLVDFDTDGELDLYVACRRAGQRNQLYRGTEAGLVLLEDSTLALEHAWLGPFAWIPGSSEHGPDLVYAHSNTIWLYRNEGGGTFSPVTITHIAGEVENFAIDDINDDGLPDIFASSTAGSVLLSSNGAGNHPKSFSKVNDSGLPNASLHAEWVDINNDGTLELYSIPGGIFHLDAAGVYQQDRALTTFFDIAPLQARGSWPDLNGDGSRDLVMAVQFKPSFLETAIQKVTGSAFFNKSWQQTVFINENAIGNWIQVELDDGMGGAASTGAVIHASRRDGREQHSFAWASESSHASQGHYRAYFGLGEYAGPIDVEVRWPDGSVAHSTVDSPNQRVLIKKPSRVLASGFLQ